VRIVAALGGNALLRRGERLDHDVQRAHLAQAARALGPLAEGNELVITHGNGPQIGMLALQTSTASGPYPLDVLGAETEGMIGYLLEQELGNVIGSERVVTVLTQVIVAVDDPAFRAPAKPIGPVYGEGEAHRLARERGWNIARDGAKWRRVVASPRPCNIVELNTIRVLIDAGVIVICAGGGGVPVVRELNRLRGVEAVVDKDLTAALLARDIGADALLLLTDVDAVYANFGKADARALRHVTPAEAETLALPAGSMRPKVAAAAWFATQTGHYACIGALEHAADVLHGRGGTSVARQ